MDIFKERIQPLFDAKKKHGTSDAEMERAIGVPAHSVNKWRGGLKSWRNYLPQIANYFSVSVDYLAGASDEENHPVRSGELSRELTAIVKRYNELDDEGKAQVENVIFREESRVKMAKEISELKRKMKMEVGAEIIRLPLPLSYQPVSAGRGAYLGPEEFETIFVEENSLTKLASFAVRVSGNSMEPTYNDGDILLIQGAEDIRIGEIGVFTLNGDGYVKERGNGELISLNPEYAPIPMNDSVWCNGRVIGKLDHAWIAGK